MPPVEAKNIDPSINFQFLGPFHIGASTRSWREYLRKKVSLALPLSIHTMRVIWACDHETPIPSVVIVPGTDSNPERGDDTYGVIAGMGTAVCLNLVGGTILPKFLFQKLYISGVACYLSVPVYLIVGRQLMTTECPSDKTI